ARQHDLWRDCSSIEAAIPGKSRSSHTHHHPHLVGGCHRQHNRPTQHRNRIKHLRRRRSGGLPVMNSAHSVSGSVTVESEFAAGPQAPDYPPSGQSIVCFAGEDWWYHHPHSKNHILKRLARHNRVLFVNSITMGLPSISSPEFFQKIRRKLRSYLRWLRKVPEGLWVMTPINVPLYGSRMGRALNRLLLILQLRLVMFVLNLCDPIVWVAIPTAADIVGS